MWMKLRFSDFIPSSPIGRLLKTHSSPTGRLSSIRLINFILISVTPSPFKVSKRNLTSTAICTYDERKSTLLRYFPTTAPWSARPLWKRRVFMPKYIPLFMKSHLSPTLQLLLHCLYRPSCLVSNVIPPFVLGVLEPLWWTHKLFLGHMTKGSKVILIDTVGSDCELLRILKRDGP